MDPIVERNPGIVWVVTATTGWKPEPPDEFAWTAWRPLPDGMAERRFGFEPTMQEALTLAIESSTIGA